MRRPRRVTRTSSAPRYISQKLPAGFFSFLVCSLCAQQRFNCLPAHKNYTESTIAMHILTILIFYPYVPSNAIYPLFHSHMMATQGAKAAAKAPSKDWDVDTDGVSGVSLADADSKVRIVCIRTV